METEIIEHKCEICNVSCVNKYKLERHFLSKRHNSKQKTITTKLQYE